MKNIYRFRSDMNRQLQLLAAVLLCTLFAVECPAQNDHDSALLANIELIARQRFHTTLFWNDENGNVTAISCKGIKGDFDALLKLEHLKSITIEEMKSGWLERIAERYPNLKSLDFDASLIELDELNILGEFKNLSRLVITGGNSDCSACLSKVGEITGLQSLVIPPHWERNLHEIKSLTELEFFRMGLRTWAFDSEEFTVKTDHSSIHHLYRLLVELQKRSSKDASEVLGLFKNGRLAFYQLSDEMIPYLSKLDNVAELSLNIGGLSKEGLDSLKLPSGLKKLSLSGITKPTGFVGLPATGDMKQLEYLEITNCRVGEDGLSFVGTLKGLKHLDLSDNQLDSLDGLNIDSLRQLEHLDLSDNRLSQFDFSRLAKLKNLANLKLGGVKLSDVDLKELSNVGKLDYLNWRDGQITQKSRFKLYQDLNWSAKKSLSSEGVRLFKKGDKLIINHEVEFSNELLQAISQLKPPSEIFISKNVAAMKIVGLHPFQKLTFSSCNDLKDDSIEQLSTNQNIKSLNIDGSDLVTDKGFRLLEKMTWLEEFRFRGAGVSETAKEVLKEKLPNCKVLIR